MGKDLVNNAQASDWLRRSNCGKLNIVKGITWVIYDALFLVGNLGEHIVCDTHCVYLTVAGLGNFWCV